MWKVVFHVIDARLYDDQIFFWSDLTAFQLFSFYEKSIRLIMSNMSKTIGTLIATAVVGSLTFILGRPGKVLQNKVKSSKSSKQSLTEDKDSLFV